MIARFKKGSYRWSTIAVVLLALLGCVFLTNARGVSQAENEEPEVLAEQFVELLVKGQFAKAVEGFDTAMKESLPTDKLAQTWRTTTGQAGLFKQQLGTRLEKFLGSDIVFVTCEFEKGPMDVKVVYDSNRKVSGLWFLPTPQKVLEEYRTKAKEKPHATQKMKTVNLSYGDGSSEGKKSIAGSGHAVLFEAPAEGSILKAVRIYGSRYGYPAPPKEDFHIWLCDKDSKVIKDFRFPYARFTRGNPKWVTLRVAPTPVPQNFMICAGFNPERTKGVYVHYDDSGSGNSFTGLPGRDSSVFNQGEWMIQAILSAPSAPAVAPGQSAPVVVETSPQAFANNVSPKLTSISVTFDQPMMDGSWSWTGGGDTYPQMTGRPYYDQSKRTCTMPVKLKPDKVYWVGINSPSHKNFKTPSRQAAPWYIILFATRSVDGKPTPIPEERLARARQINSAAGHLAPATLRPKTTPDGKLVIPSQRPWTDTRIDVKTGDEIHLLATGTMHGCRGPKEDWAYGPWGPDGQVFVFEHGKAYVSEQGNPAGKRLFALVGRIGDKEFHVGTKATITAPVDGRLHLGISDSYHSDNVGAFTVEAEVSPTTQPEELWKRIAQRKDKELRREALDQVLSMLKDDQSKTQALQTLSRVADVPFDREPFLKEVRQALNDPEPDIRAAALQAISATGGKPEDLPAVIQLADDEAEQVRAVIPRAIYSLDPTGQHKSIAGVIEDLLDDESELVKRATIRSVWSKPLTSVAEDKLLVLSHDGSLGYDTVYYALSTRPVVSLPVAHRLIELMDERNGRALWGLTHHRAASNAQDVVARALIRNLDEILDSGARVSCIWGLGLHGGSEAIARLKELAVDDEESKSIRQEAMKSLRRLGVNPG